MSRRRASASEPPTVRLQAPPRSTLVAFKDVRHFKHRTCFKRSAPSRHAGVVVGEILTTSQRLGGGAYCT